MDVVELIVVVERVVPHGLAAARVAFRSIVFLAGAQHRGGEGLGVGVAVCAREACAESESLDDVELAVDCTHYGRVLVGVFLLESRHGIVGVGEVIGAVLIVGREVGTHPLGGKERGVGTVAVVVGHVGVHAETQYGEHRSLGRDARTVAFEAVAYHHAFLIHERERHKIFGAFAAARHAHCGVVAYSGLLHEVKPVGVGRAQVGRAFGQNTVGG